MNIYDKQPDTQAGAHYTTKPLLTPMVKGCVEGELMSAEDAVKLHAIVEQARERQEQQLMKMISHLILLLSPPERCRVPETKIRLGDFGSIDKGCGS